MTAVMNFEFWSERIPRSLLQGVSILSFELTLSMCGKGFSATN
jgi:hypothetical protein